MVDNKQGLEERLNKFLDKNDRHIVCSNCGTINYGINTFCTNCKQSFDKLKKDKVQKCPKCFSDINVNDIKCKNCGCKLEIKKNKNDNNLAIWIFVFFVISVLYFPIAIREMTKPVMFMEGLYGVAKHSEDISVTLLITYIGLACFYWGIYWLINSDPVTKKPKPTTKTLKQEIEELKQQIDILKENKNIDEINSHKITETIASKKEKDILSNG